MIQGGGLRSRTWSRKKTKAPIKNEATNGLKNERGTLAMARTSDPNSATAQFFINTCRQRRFWIIRIPGGAMVTRFSAKSSKVWMSSTRFPRFRQLKQGHASELSLSSR